MDLTQLFCDVDNFVKQHNNISYNRTHSIGIPYGGKECQKNSSLIHEFNARI